jgi:glycosyltransferase involved in cell wall biosynthesis
MDTVPVFSIIIPTYNRAGLITGTLNSVLNQTYQSFEIIIVDDGSTDNTENVLQPFLQQYSNIFYFKKNNEERGAARNYGTMRAMGDYVTFLDSDDIFYPNHLQEAVNLIQQNNSPEVFHLAYEIIRTDGSIVQKFNRPHGSLNLAIVRGGNVLSCMGVFIKRKIAAENPFVEDRELSGSEDYELWLRLAAKYEFAYSNTITSAITHHPGRSVLEPAQKNALIKRVEKVLWHVMNNELFQQKYSEYNGRIRALNYCYMSLYLGLAHYRKEAIHYLWLSMKEYPMIVFSKNFLAALKYIFGFHAVPGRFRS